MAKSKKTKVKTQMPKRTGRGARRALKRGVSRDTPRKTY